MARGPRLLNYDVVVAGGGPAGATAAALLGAAEEAVVLSAPSDLTVWLVHLQATNASAGATGGPTASPRWRAWCVYDHRQTQMHQLQQSYTPTVTMLNMQQLA